jgi:hypothetical protein
MTRGKGAKPYVFKEWPKMFYHAETGLSVVVRKASLIPEGHVDHISKVGKSEEEIDAEAQATIDADKARVRLERAEAADLLKAQKADDKAALVIFKKFKTTRDEAEQMLEEDGEDFDPDADDLTIAMAIKELLEDASE